jgi:hypothetical protein
VMYLQQITTKSSVKRHAPVKRHTPAGIVVKQAISSTCFVLFCFYLGFWKHLLDGI